MSLFERTRTAAADLRTNPLVRIVFVSLGFTLIYTFWVIKPAVEPSQIGFYHWTGTAENFFIPYFVYILATCFFIALLLLLARKPGRMRVAIWTGLILFISCVLIKLNIFYHRFDSEPLAFMGAASVTLLLTIGWRRSFAERFERILAPITTVLIFLGLFCTFILCQLTWYALRGSMIAQGSPLHHRQAPATIQPHRVIWIVFDELSYQQTYERRYPGLQLPAFDALAADSTIFTKATPFDVYTEVVLPGLLSGEPFNAIRTSSSVEPSVHNATTGKWQAFQQHNTVFQDALNDGYSTAVAGWYNPYCRILPAVVDSCFWTYRNAYNFMFPSNSTFENVIAPIEHLIWFGLRESPARLRVYLISHLHIPAERSPDAQGHIDDYTDLDAHSQALLRDRSYGFVLLHLPVPHPWGIYDRHTGKFITAGSSYINNLALADKCLAGIRQTLEQTGQWDSSTVVVMGDHSWRTQQIWHVRPLSPDWAKEDEIASHGGQYDPRPAYLVKLPNQTTPALIDTPYRTVNTRKLIDKIMAHQINTPADLSTWVHTLPAPN